MKPEILLYLKGYTRRAFTRDVVAGIIVGIIAIPLSVALAIASGASPETGLYTAILAGFTAALLGGSAVQITGPTGAFVVIVYGIIREYGMSGLIAATLMAGIILMIMGFARLGSVIRYVPFPVTVGFTAGIALTILTGQINDFTGMGIASVPADFVDKIIVYTENLKNINLVSVAVGLVSVVLILLWPRVSRKIPGSLVAIVVMTVLSQLLHWPIATIGSRFADLSGSFPALRLPLVDFATLRQLIQPAITIAILGGVESLLSAVVADEMTGTRHNASQELIGQGAANIVSSLFGGLPATGAIARTAANIRNGGISPVSGIVHALTVLLITVLFMPWAKLIPMPVLAAILVVVCRNMIEVQAIRKIMKSPRSDQLLMFTTFALTVLFDLVVAIEAGLIMAALLFMKRMAETASINERTISGTAKVDGLAVFRLNGAFFFAAAQGLIREVEQAVIEKEAIIIEMQRVPALDATGVHVLESLAELCAHHQTRLYLVRLQQQPADVLAKSGFTGPGGESCIMPDLQSALDACQDLID